MSFLDGDIGIWTISPNWQEPIKESLSWKTDVLQSIAGDEQHRKLRIAPRRMFTFNITRKGQLFRLQNLLRYSHLGKKWYMPIWTESQIVGAISSGASTISCVTTDFDFVAGGKAMLWRNPTTFEVVTINTVGSGVLNLVGTTNLAWPVGTRLYPVRRVRIKSPAEETLYTDDLSQSQIMAELDEPCDWTAVAPSDTYRSYPVMERRGNEREDPRTGYSRLLVVLDGETGPVDWVDVGDYGYKQQSISWLGRGRADQADLRSLLYWLAGRFGKLWVPSFTNDLQLSATIGSSDTTITVEWCGYSDFGDQQLNARDIRIELKNGTVFYRRITASTDGGSTETLTINASLGTTVAVNDVRLISFMFFGQQLSDDLDLIHHTDSDGFVEVSSGFQAIRNTV